MQFRSIGPLMLGLLVVLGGARGAAAQAAQPENPYQPPVLAEPGAGIGLLDAVRLTLANDPNLLLRATDVDNQLGVAQEQAGVFDWTLSGEASWEHREQELLSSQKQGEEDKRNQIRDLEAATCQLQADFEQKLADLRRAQAGQFGVDIRTDRGFEANLRIIEAAIQAADSAAQRQELEQVRRNLIQTEIAATEDAVTEAEFGCIEAGEALERLGGVPDEEEFDIGRLNLRLDKLTRTGLLFAAFLDAGYDSTEFVGKRRGFFVPATNPAGEPLFSPSGIPLERLIDFGGKNVEPVYQANVGFEVNIPLLRNRGAAATGAAERAAQVDYEATAMLLEHAASESVLNTVAAYWNLVAAQNQVRILETSVELQGRVLDVTQALVDAQELPEAELARSLAGHASAQAQLESARQDLIAARLDLVRAMGLDAEAEESAYAALDSFPLALDAARLQAIQTDLARTARTRRRDLQAARELVQSGSILARAAELDLKPLTDLSLRTFATARGDNGFSDSFSTWVYPSWRVATRFEKPLGNNTAKGRLAQADALMRQRQISEGDLDRLIHLAVLQASGSLVEALDQLEHAEAAARSFEETVQAEVTKLELGETTLLDVVLTEQQRTQALLALEAARFDVATLLARLRFESGTLVEHLEAQSRVTEEALTTLPATGDAS